MFENIEEKIEHYQLRNSTCSNNSYNLAEKILDQYKTFSSSIKYDIELAEKYTAININNHNAIEEIALLVTVACYRALGRKWQIPGAKITWKIIPRIPQISGGIELCGLNNKNLFARQRTGEGKTVTLLFVIAYLAKKGSVHIMTANDYLAKRDQMWVGPILDMLGISNAWLSDNRKLKKKVYSANVIYGSDKEFTFDYLRDTIRKPGATKICPNREYIVIDEADHILLDELSTPIVLSQSVEGANVDMKMANEIITSLKNIQITEIGKLIKEVDEDYNTLKVNDEFLKKIISLRYCGVCYDKIKTYYSKMHKEISKSEKLEMILMQTNMLEEICDSLYFIVDTQRNICYFTEKGLKTIEERFLKKRIFTIPDYNLISSRIHKTELKNLYKEKLLTELNIKENSQNSIIRAFLLALQAHMLLHIDQDYIIKNGEVELITKSIGRSDAQKRFDQDLSLAVELKEGVTVREKTAVVSSTLLPNFISLYKRFAALSGTIFPDQEEFGKTYSARLFNVPTFKDVIAYHEPGRIYETKIKKHKALLRNIKFLNSLKRPVLIGTNSVNYSEELSQILSDNGITHKVLNARNEFEEAEIVAKAGETGSIVVATNIAGRGTDIKVDDSVNDQICKEYIKLIKEKLAKKRSVNVTCYSVVEKNVFLKYLKELSLSKEFVTQKKRGERCEILLEAGPKKRVFKISFHLGLHVIVAETFMSRRIENQLRGRTGRQGAPGSSSMYFSLEDDNLHSISSMTSLIRRVLFDKFSFPGNIQSVHNYLISMVNRINEGNEREKRKERLFYDRITEVHRKKIEMYRNLLHESSINSYMKLVIDTLIDDLAGKLKKGLEEERMEEFGKSLLATFNVRPEFLKHQYFIDIKFLEKVKGFIWQHYLKIEQISENRQRSFKEVLCAIIDELWAQYLEHLSSFREQSGRSMYLGKDDKVYYINLVSEYFNSIFFEIRKASAINVFHKELPHERNNTPAKRRADLEDEISELIL